MWTTAVLAHHFRGRRFGPWWALRPNMNIPWHLNINATSSSYCPKSLSLCGVVH